MMRVELPSPRRAPWVVVHSPMEPGAPWIVERAGANPLRVSADMGALLAALDGERDHSAIAELLGPRWTPDLVDGAVRQLSGIGLLDDDNATEPPKEKRFLFISPVIIQLRMIEAGRILEPFRSVLTRLRGPAVLIASLVLSLGGLLALAVQHPVLSQALGAPVSISSVVLIWAGLGAATVLHEFSHGATLTHFRGRPGWFGVMLFYLTPACFCEVTDSWRLPRPGQRIAVALAGVAAQCSIAGAAAIAGFAFPAGDTRTTLIGFAIACYLTGVVNFVPFVKLDGYLALMAYVDIPHLREKSIADARGWWARRLFGVSADRELPKVKWAVPYGMACVAFPVVVLLLVMARWTHLLAGAGFVGAAVALLLIGYLVYRLGKSLLGLVRGARWIRVAAFAIAVSVLSLAFLTLVKVPYSVQAGYVKDGDGIHLVLPNGIDRASVEPGQRVVLQRTGLVFSTDLVQGEIGVGEARVMSVPTSALLPIRWDVPISASTVPLVGVRAADVDPTGGAYLEEGSLPVGEWLLRRYVAPAWTEVFGFGFG